MPTAESDWVAMFDSIEPALRGEIRACLVGSRAAIADAFYGKMIEDAEARSFLNHEVVHQRLHASMQRWVEVLFSADDHRAFITALAMQRHVGEVHARVDVPVNLVARGMRALKAEMLKLLAAGGMPPGQLVEAFLYVSNLVDLAFEVMSSAFVQSHERTARIDEAYRAFSSGQNMSLERERQRAALLEWENRFLQGMMMRSELPQLGTSSFGLWMQHKATGAFRGTSELEAIAAAIATVDRNLLPLCDGCKGCLEEETARDLLKAVQDEIRQLRFLVDTMFERMVDLESGKDVLTQLFNRRFLPAIMTRETELARTENKSFALLVIDVDHFKHINDGHGHAAGDRVLQAIASLLQNSVRSGDFVFRYGGEEFLLLLVELDETHAVRVADKIRDRIAAEPVALPNEQAVSVTVSIGLAMFDGHPDYQRLINRADAAVYLAKERGRNCCVLVPAAPAG